MAQLTASAPVVIDCVATVDPYRPGVPEWVGVAIEDAPDGRHVLLTSCGGLKVEFRVPVGNAEALAAAIRDAADPGYLAA